MTAIRHSLPEQRWHFQHGPIDLIIGAEGEPVAVATAHEAAWQRFQTILDELVGELRTLRFPVEVGQEPVGVVANRMWTACRAFSPEFITPMAAVAGAVADEIVDFYKRDGVNKAWVNNGGDVAFYFGAEAGSIRLGIIADSNFASSISVDGLLTIEAVSDVRGVATSGWHGRSFSMGIADAATVLGKTSAQADAAATIIGNAVNIESKLVERAPACSLRDDSDLGDRLVTVHVPRLPFDAVALALDRGMTAATKLRSAGLIESALLQCQGQIRWIGASRFFLAKRLR
jgi:uncharacterized protein